MGGPGARIAARNCLFFFCQVMIFKSWKRDGMWKFLGAALGMMGTMGDEI